MRPQLAARRDNGYAWASVAVAAATGLFWLARHSVDKGQASLLYLPVVLACAARFGFGPAIASAALSFVCWDYFFLPPFHLLTVDDPKDWLSLFIFLIIAVTTAHLAARARNQARRALARETEIETLFQASETISREVRAESLLTALTEQLRTLCHASRCLVFRREADSLHAALIDKASINDEGDLQRIALLAEAAWSHDCVIGFGSNRHLWAKALAETETPLGSRDPATLGVCIPLRAADSLVGVLYVGPRDNEQEYSTLEERLILTLANHAAVVIARDILAEHAAQASALREADVLKDALVSLVSHELRTPLAAIKASVSGLLQSDSEWGDDERREALAAIDGETDRLSGVVSSLLDLSRLEAGAWIPNKDWCDLAEVASTALDRLPPRDAARVELMTDSDLPLVRADYTQMALVLTNLLENAVKYTPTGSPIALTVQPGHNGVDEEASSVLVQVRDYGLGLLPGEEDRLFDRFYRGRRHQAGAIHGTGLGLALCAAIVQAHEGRIWAANAPAGEPQGAVFSFVLPRG